MYGTCNDRLRIVTKFIFRKSEFAFPSVQIHYTSLSDTIAASRSRVACRYDLS